MTLLVGAPATGKSTYAQGALDEADPDTLVSNRDRIRAQSFCDGYAGTPRDEKREQLVTRQQLDEVRAALRARRRVIIDDTNLDPRVRASWAREARDADADLQILTFDVPLEIALERNAHRHGRARVPDRILRDMHRLACEQLRTLEGPA